jgi:hypothetical protein
MEDRTKNLPEWAEPTPSAQPQIDKLTAQQNLQRLREEQNLPLGILGGAVGAILGAILWALITILFDVQIGYMALGVGLLAGGGVRLLGKGLGKHYGVVGAVMAVLGCLLGNVLAAVGIISKECDILRRLKADGFPRPRPAG